MGGPMRDPARWTALFSRVSGIPRVNGL